MNPDDSKPKFKRILLKLSGEALSGDEKTGIDPEILSGISEEIKEIHDLGVQVAVVVGAGNFFRGAMGEKLGINRKVGDHMGMIATIINSLAMQDRLVKLGLDSRVMSAIEMNEIAEPYIIQKAVSHLNKGRIIIAAAGTGHPFFTTDTAASLRAIEIGADVLIKATRVDGVYTGDPEKDSCAVKLEQVTYLDVIKDKLRVMDLTAISLCMDNHLPIIVFNLFEKGSLKKLVMGDHIGTRIC